MKIKPEKLKKGDTIGVISPSGAVKEKKMLEKAVNYFENKGYRVKPAPHILDQNAYLAGKDADRLNDLENFFRDKEVKAIVCSRGGYGASRLLDKINYQIIKDNPKIFVGYSDITAFLNVFSQKTDLITFHGPLFVSDFGADRVDSYTEEVFFNLLSKNNKTPFKYPNPIEYHCIIPGEITGELIGGNLAVLCGLVGTPYMPDVEGKILLLEDVGEPLYKIDRMLTQLKLSRVFEKISGLLFAEFSSVLKADNNEVNRYTPLDIVSEITKGMDIPVGYGFPAGHSRQKATLPIGMEYFFNSEDFQLKTVEIY